MPGIDIPQLLNLIKADVMGWINSGIANAKLSGVVINYVPSTSTPTDITLPNTIAYTNISNAFNENQNIAKTFTDATGQSQAGLNLNTWVSPTSNDTGGIKIGIWSTVATVAGGVNNTTNLWSGVFYGVHYGLGKIDRLIGLAATSENYNAGSVDTMQVISSQVHNRGAGTVNYAQGLQIQNVNNSGGGTIGAIAGVSIGNQGAAKIGTAYGLNIDAQSGAVTNYAIYSAGGDVNFNNTSALTSGNKRSLYEVLTSTPASSSSATFEAAVTASISAGAQNFTGRLSGLTSNVEHQGSGTVTQADGVLGYSWNSGAGTITTASGVRARIAQTGGVITSGYGVYVNSVDYTSGTLTNIAGIAVVAPGAGTNRTNLLVGTATIPSGTYSVYSAGTELSYFGGVVQFEAAHTMKQVAAPAAPASGYNKQFIKSDNHLYIEDSGGTVTQVDLRGYAPFAWSIQNGGVGQTTATLPVVSGGNGGAIAIGIIVPSHMLLQSYSYWNRDTSGAHTLEARLYEEKVNNSNTLDFVTGSDATWDSFTPSAADLRTSGAVSGAPVYLSPGVYWLVIRNTSASVQAAVGGNAAPTTQNITQTKTIAALGTTLDFVAATWTKVSASAPWASLNGRVFGRTTAF